MPCLPVGGRAVMNQKCSYRKLLANGKAALLAAIEIYNKPRIDYRDECFVILLLIFYPKKRNQPYRTYSLTDAFKKAEPLLPAGFGTQALRLNLDLLSLYRDNAVHFYNAKSFGSVIYALAQTSVVNLRDLLREIFGLELSDDITWQLLPLGLDTPIDPIDYIAGRGVTSKQSVAVKQFLAQIAKSTQELQLGNLDTGRLLTVFKVKLESTKKIENADLLVGVQKAADATTGPLIVSKPMDPNLTHPLRTKALVDAVGRLHDAEFTLWIFQAIAWKFGIKANSMFCWQDTEGNLIKYSHDAIAFIKRLTVGDVQLAKAEYREWHRSKSRKTPVTASLPFIPDAIQEAS